MASIRARLRSNGTTAWAVLYRLAGRQCTLTFDSEATANAFAVAVDAHGAQRALQMYDLDSAPRWNRTDPSGPLTVAQWVRQHLDALTGLDQAVIDNYETILAGDIERRPIGDIPIEKLREPDIQAWITTLETEGSAKRGRPNSPKTIANKHGFLSGAMNAAVAAGHIPANPLANRTLPKPKVTQDHEMRMLTVPEYERLLADTAAPWRPMIAFMVASGMRWGELSALQPQHVNRDAGTVRIRQAWKRSTAGYEVGVPKTKRSRRVINLPAAVLADLDLSGEWVFTNQVDGGPVRYPTFRRHVWDPAVAAAGLKPAPTPHDLRHTCASWMLAVGQPITTVSRHLGHQNIQITADVYTDVDRTSFAAAADAMAKILNPESTPES